MQKYAVWTHSFEAQTYQFLGLEQAENEEDACRKAHMMASGRHAVSDGDYFAVPVTVYTVTSHVKREVEVRVAPT